MDSNAHSSNPDRLGVIAHQVLRVYRSGAVVRKQTFTQENAPPVHQVECYSGVFHAVAGGLRPGKMVKLRFQLGANQISGIFHTDMLEALAKMCEEASRLVQGPAAAVQGTPDTPKTETSKVGRKAKCT